jgi:energy-coupling factor transporter ATP-binding protein EcfA2
MTEYLPELLTRIRQWFDESRTLGWLDDADVARLETVERRAPGDLFVDQQARPLVVAFFGGTGVGKSSLLNRLAGQSIARTGVERPTSHEVTVYVHESVSLAQMPPELPLGAVRVQQHQSAAQRDVLWLDAPDIDSTAEENRRCALAWLPHVDLVCYVVSPERYRDDVGWRVLRERGHRHGWAFVLNHWDEGNPAQIADFARLLHAAGFAEPLLIPTACVSGRPLPTPDRFDELQSAIATLLREHGLRELARLGHCARIAELQAAVAAGRARIGDEPTWSQVATTCRQNWRSAAAVITDGAEWSLRSAAGRFATATGSVWEQLRQRIVAPPPKHTAARDTAPRAADIVLLDELSGNLWDDWTQSKLQACLDATEVAARRAGLVTGPLRQAMEAVADTAGTAVAQRLRDRVRAALARPGSAVTRALRRATGFLMAFLPALALLWVAWKVVQAYHVAVRPGEFLGAPFAIHSALIVLLAWAVPFVLDRLLRPSLEQIVLGALRDGLAEGLADLEAELEGALADTRAAARQRQDAADVLRAALQRLLATPAESASPTVARVVQRPAQDGVASARSLPRT